MSAPRVLVVAKAPVPGRVKTRLGAEIGMGAAAEVAAAALLDTIAACGAFAPAGRMLALSGDLADAVRGSEIVSALEDWAVGRQRGATFAERLANAHADVPPGGPVLQVGMDTPQLTPELLDQAAAGLAGHDAVLGPAEDGGWWVLGLRRPGAAGPLRDVPMSTPSTYDRTRTALTAAGITVGTAATLRDVDTAADAEAVARTVPDGELARTWERVRP